MTAYYNENDPYAAQWLRNLIEAGHIAPGVVDERSIVDVRGEDLAGYVQCHFFAGIGGWSLALRLAEWHDDRPVWTGSCPCQDFSIIGQRASFSGDRDLWPRWLPLIRECRPQRVFGEQVDNAPEWADRAASDLENISYTCGTAIVPAIAVGAWHERSRLYFAAHPNETRWQDTGRIAATETKAHIGTAAGLVCRDQARHLQGPFVPDQSWIVDGLSDRGRAVSAYGNAIVPQIAAEFIIAADEAITDSNARDRK